MKFRNGFVSNSSSSSFIIGVALVPSDEIEEARKHSEAVGWSAELISIHEAISAGKSSWSGAGLDVERDVFTESSFTNDEVSIRGVLAAYEKDQNTMILKLSGSGDTPEYNEDSWEYNYDAVDYDWFSSEQQECASFIESLGGRVSIGAGRNG